ncbi:hypothetical protein GCK32_019384 [Trichostrongylus colubriformis]|uniref:Uncharacterized protein n=1 Tax=Trichostrongylus colubriformis TaxID=6319 RepID=A0AAN8IEY6_TRICO
MGPPTTRARAKATNSGVVATQQQITLIKDEGTPGAAEVAVNKAQAVEHLLAEATAERLINPAGSSAGISALGVPRQTAERLSAWTPAALGLRFSLAVASYGQLMLQLWRHRPLCTAVPFSQIVRPEADR